MASRNRNRKVVRRSLGRKFWWSFWLVALAVVIAVGLVESSLTQIVFARVTASQPGDWDRIRGILKSIDGRPALTISAYRVEQLVESDPRVAKAEFSANLFGRSRLSVAYRVPVALLATDPRFGIDETGFVFRLSEAESANVAVAINLQDYSPNLTLADPSEVYEALILAQNFQVEGKKLGGIVAFDAGGRLCFNVRNGAVVVFGSVDRLEEKLRVLESAIRADPGVLSRQATLNLVEPDAPKIQRFIE